MPFFQMDDGFDSEERVGRAGTAAFGLYSRCGVWVARNLTDGFVPEWVATMYGSAEWVRKLVETGLWLPVDGGFMMPDYLERHRNKTKARVLAERALKAARQANWLAAKKEKPSSNGKSVERRVSRRVRDASQDAARDGLVTPAPPLPSPKGEGVGAAPLSGGAAPPTQQPAPVPRDSPPLCATHQLPVPCRGCFADAKAAATPPPPPRQQPPARADPHPLAATGPDAAYDHAQDILRRLPLGDLDPLLTEARADLDAEGNPNPTTREITLRAAHLATTNQPEPEPESDSP